MRRGQQFSGIEGEDCVNLPYIWQEIKWVEKLNIRSAMGQATSDAEDRIPIVAHKQNHKEWLVTMRAEDWFKLYKQFVGEEL